ncbi:hypothetical protein FQN60_017041 [Etheostoma spectabile]|uniref:Uncharacterized protein n=1 Tax=Etheostoma spectabile TaxID=54343 RepID=A0A5J5DED6_9PERO|nr:hypothetical protein FQN60_017041 [Etheostoma spectabile]
MESVVRVKKTLRTPIRKLTSCVSGVKERELCAKRRKRRGRDGRARGGCNRLGRTPPLQPSHPKEPSIICSYQADLEMERQANVGGRKLREAMNTQKNAERAAMRAHFRSKYKLSESPKDTNHLRSVGGKVSLPYELSKIIHPETKTKDDGFNLLSAFQGLSFGTVTLTGRTHRKASTPTPLTCKFIRGMQSTLKDLRLKSMCIPVTVCVRAQGTCGSSTGVRKRGVGGQVRSFEEIPHTGKSGWVNLVKFWREDRFRQLHKHMERTFNALGPIYRNGEEWRADRLLLNKEVMMSAPVKRFLPLLDEVAMDFCQMLRARVEREGRGEEGKRSLTMDPSPDLFRFALEASCHVIYGERIGLFSSSPSVESQKFIWAVERMLATTPPLLYVPPRLLLHIGAPLWTQHASAWDHICNHAEARIQKGCQRLSSSQAQGSEAGAAGSQYTGVLGQLMEKGQLSLDLIKANITELMAGGVDTYSRAPAVCSV